jgi:hypothetical protein
MKPLNLMYMNIQINSLRTFIGAKDFTISRSFYTDLSFKEIIIDSNLSLFHKNEFGFYLQNYYAKEWLENSMLFLEVDDAQKTFEELKQTGLDRKYSGSKISPVKKEVWGEVCFVHDPSGVLLHFAQVYK